MRAATQESDHPHRHVHGANLAFSADAYGTAGGFPAGAEDVDFVYAAETAGLCIVYAH
jgi:GT2 family glycosyltransferase